MKENFDDLFNYNIEEEETIPDYSEMTIEQLISEKHKLESDLENYKDCEYVTWYISECIHEINKQINIEMYGNEKPNPCLHV